MIIDGDAGRIHLSPTEADLDSARAWIAQAEAARRLPPPSVNCRPIHGTAIPSPSAPTSSAPNRSRPRSNRAPKAWA
ncbi:hypothetical protein WJ968_12845 [Achromobacter xylosoxidans]